MPAKLFDSGKSIRNNVILDDGPNILVIVTRLDEFHCLDPRIVRRLEKLLPCIVDLTTDEHFRAISVVSVQVDGNVKIDNISIQQLAIVRNLVGGAQECG